MPDRSLPAATCDRRDHAMPMAPPDPLEPGACERAVAIFRALGDPARLRILCLLMAGERCVTEIAQAMGDSLPAISQRLRLLRGERIVCCRRNGKHVIYALADQHIGQLVTNALAHANEDGDTDSG